VLKVDVSIHVKGRMVDSAFKLTWDHMYDKLLDAVKDATNTGIRVGVRDLSVWHSNLVIGEHPGSWDRRPPGGIGGTDSRNDGPV
jgi:methionyl aminopeptidase